MRFVYISLEGYTVSWARRLQDEGHEVIFYCKKDTKHEFGKGIVNVSASLQDAIKWGLQDPSTIFFFDSSHMGEQADRLRKAGKLVIGGGAFMDRLEEDRKYGEKIAQKCGINVPPTKSFGSITETINYLNTNPPQMFGDGGWAWKPDADIGCDATLVAKDSQSIVEHVEQIRRRFKDNLKCILQEKIKGTAVSTARWWNGLSWVGPFEGTIENKKAWDKNLGPATGCSLDMVWFYREPMPRIGQELQWDKLAEVFRKENAPPGLYDINCILDHRTAWFLEWTPRLGVDSELTSFRGITNLGQFLFSLVHGKPVDEFFDIDQIYCEVRLSIPPYPHSVDTKEVTQKYKSPAEGVPIRGVDGLWDKYYVMGGIAFDPEQGIHSVDPYGMIGFVVCAGNSISKTFEKMYNWIKDSLKVPDLQYRTDAAKIIQDDVDDMMKNGWNLTEVLKK